MSHCYSASFDIDGKRETMCMIVPKNKALQKELEAREATEELASPGVRVKPMRDLTATEVENAVDFFRSTKGANKTMPYHELQHVTGQKNPDTALERGTPKKFFEPPGPPPPPPIGKQR